MPPCLPMSRPLLLSVLLLLTACGAEDAQPDRPSAWRVSGDLVATTGDGCAWEGGESIEFDLECLAGDRAAEECESGDIVCINAHARAYEEECPAGPRSPDDARIFCDDPQSADGDRAWFVRCLLYQEAGTCETAEFPVTCKEGEAPLTISKSDGTGTLTWTYDGCTFEFDVAVSDI